MKFKCSFIQVVIILVFGLFFPSSAYAYVVYGGTKNIKVGESVSLETEPSTYYTVTGSWSIEGNACVFSSRSNRSCTISGIREGEATVKWVGVVGSADYEYYWYINVFPSDNDNNGGDDNNGGGNSSDEDNNQINNGSWADSYDISWYNKSNDVFVLSTNQALAGVAYLVNNGYTTFKGKTIKLGSDIDLSGKDWMTIGLNKSQSFEGSFDGQGHTISGIYITQQPMQNVYGFWGYFNGVSILNTTFKGEMNVKNPDFDDNTGNWLIGGIVGQAPLSSTIDKCISNMNISFSISKTGKHVYVGGICGETGGSCIIRRCSHIGNFYIGDYNKMVSSQGNILASIGGIVGVNYNCVIEKCENISSEVLFYVSAYEYSGWKMTIPVAIGGISGCNGKVSYCRSVINKLGFANGSTTGDAWYYLGGVIGTTTASVSSTLNAINCYSVINNAELGKGQLWYSNGGVIYGGIIAKTKDSSPSKANFSNSDYSIVFPKWVSIDTKTGDNGDGSFSSEQMKTDNFLNQLNTYSIIEEGKGIWSPDENGYPCIAESHCMTGINRIVLNRDDLPIYRLNGQRLDKPCKGINIIGGKKVIMK